MRRLGERRGPRVFTSIEFFYWRKRFFGRYIIAVSDSTDFRLCLIVSGLAVFCAPGDLCSMVVMMMSLSKEELIF